MPKTVPPPPTPVVVIDGDDDVGADDGDAASEVFIIDDAAEIARAAAACNTKKGNSSCGNVINIDDEEEEGGGGDRAGPSTVDPGSPAATVPPGHAFPRRRFGLDYVTDSEQSDLSGGWDSDSDGDGSSDCEILDDTGMARKVWENAASRRTTPHDLRKGKDGRASTSASSAESSTQYGVNFGNLFDSECPLDDNIWRFFNDDAVNKAGPSSTRGGKFGTGPSVPDVHECSMHNDPNGKETGNRDGTCSSDADTACNNEAANAHKSHAPEKSPEISQSRKPEGHTSYSFVSANRVFPACSTANWKADSAMFVCSTGKMDEKIPEGTLSEKDISDVQNEISKQKKQMCFAPDDGSAMDQLSKDPVSTSRSVCSSQSQKDFSSDPEKLGQSGIAMVQDGPDFQDGLIGAREKHKESIEYKRAAEEEWASRQHQLAIQAEQAKEAKRLRKRKKAEALRLLDMEKRQKQRLEEVRESQRKSEEAIQLKEQSRGAVRMELENMERRYNDMSSILRALGIPVEGGEVKAAYKQACLKFHPDRVSRNDIYQQVRAEETFKFISRLKEKLKL